MAKKAAKVVAAAEVVPEALVGLDIPALNQLIQQAQSRIQSLDSGTREERRAAFKKSDFYKTFKQKVAAIKAEVKAAMKEGKGTFEATIRFSVKTIEQYSVDDGVYQGYGDLFDFEVVAGKVSGEGLTKEQKQRLEEAVDEYAGGMCEEGMEVFFPKLREGFQTLEEKISDLNTELETELQNHHLSTDDLAE